LEGIVRCRTALVALVTFVLMAAAACTSGNDGGAGKSASPSATTHHAAAPGAASTKASPKQLRAQFEQLLGQHSLLAVRLMRSIVSGPPEVQQAIGASMRENTDALRQICTSAYGAAQADRFAQLWQGHVDALGAYATAVAKGDASGKAAARAKLTAYPDAHGAWFASASKGTVRAGDAAAGVRAHIQELIQQLDAYAARDYAKAYQLERMAYEHMFTAGATMAKASITPELAVGFDAPPEKLRSAFSMLLGEHMELIVSAQRATFAGAPQFKAAGAQLNANTTSLAQAMGTIVGPAKGAEFQTAWANHVEGLIAYSTATAGKDEAGKAAAKRNLDAFANRLALYFSDIVRKELPVEPLISAISQHDTHLIGQVDAYAAKDYAKAQQMEREGYQQMLGVANTLVSAIQRTMKLPAGGSQTGGGGTAHDHHGTG
jgi:hypothetical protein